MRKLKQTREQLSNDYIQKATEDFSTLDGFVYDCNTGSFSYDNDFDQTFPSILEGVRNPSQEERTKSRPPKQYFMPSQLRNLRKASIQDWDLSEINLTEVLSRYPQISARVGGLGKRKAYEFKALLTFLAFEYKPLLSTTLGSDIFETIKKRCLSNAFEGDWKFLSKLLTLVHSCDMSSYLIKEKHSQREINGNLIPIGRKFFNDLFIELTAYPVTPAARKRGYKDKGSRKDPHEVHDLSTSTSKISSTRDIEPLTGKQGLVAFLYGVSAPAKIIVESTMEINYRKRMNRQLNHFRRQLAKRIKQLSGPVTYSKRDIEDKG
jgi:hypothetical protein